MTIRTDETHKNIIIDSDEQLKLLNENHILETLGFSQTSEEELSQFIDQDLVNFLKQQKPILGNKETLSRKDSL